MISYFEASYAYLHAAVAPIAPPILAAALVYAIVNRKTLPFAWHVCCPLFLPAPPPQRVCSHPQSPAHPPALTLGSEARTSPKESHPVADFLFL